MTHFRKYENPLSCKYNNPLNDLPSLSKNTFQNNAKFHIDVLRVIIFYELYQFLSNSVDINYKEEDMFKPKIIRLLILKLLEDGDYSLEGLSSLTNIPIDILNDIIYEINPNPSFGVTIKIIEYFIIIKRHEYSDYIRKIIQYMDNQKDFLNKI